MFPHSFGSGIGFGEFRSFSVLSGRFRILFEKKCIGVLVRAKRATGGWAGCGEFGWFRAGRRSCGYLRTATENWARMENRGWRAQIGDFKI